MKAATLTPWHEINKVARTCRDFAIGKHPLHHSNERIIVFERLVSIDILQCNRADIPTAVYQ